MVTCGIFGIFGIFGGCDPPLRGKRVGALGAVRALITCGGCNPYGLGFICLYGFVKARQMAEYIKLNRKDLNVSLMQRSRARAKFGKTKLNHKVITFLSLILKIILVLVLVLSV